MRSSHLNQIPTCSEHAEARARVLPCGGSCCMWGARIWFVEQTGVT